MEIWWWDSSPSSSCSQGICWSAPSPLLDVLEENCSIHFPLRSKNKVEPLTPSSAITAIILEIQIFPPPPQLTCRGIFKLNNELFFQFCIQSNWFWAHVSVVGLFTPIHKDVEDSQLSKLISAAFVKCNQFIWKYFQCGFALQVQPMINGQQI